MVRVMMHCEMLRLGIINLHSLLSRSGDFSAQIWMVLQFLDLICLHLLCTHDCSQAGQHADEMAEMREEVAAKARAALTAQVRVGLTQETNNALIRDQPRTHAAEWSCKKFVKSM